MRTSVPSTRSAYCRARVAVAERVCKKLSAARSPVSNIRALPISVRIVVSAGTSSPSLTCQIIWISSSSCLNTSSTQGRPQIVAGSLEITTALACLSAAINCAVISPVPISSCSARATHRGISLAVAAGKSISAIELSFILNSLLYCIFILTKYYIGQSQTHNPLLLVCASGSITAITGLDFAS